MSERSYRHPLIIHKKYVRATANSKETNRIYNGLLAEENKIGFFSANAFKMFRLIFYLLISGTICLYHRTAEPKCKSGFSETQHFKWINNRNILRLVCMFSTYGSNNINILIIDLTFVFTFHSKCEPNLWSECYYF